MKLFSFVTATVVSIGALRCGAATIAGCVPSLRAAVGSSIERDVMADGGFRVVQEKWDGVLGMRWAMVEECAHPERPWRAVRLAESAKLLEVANRPAAKPVSASAVQSQPLLVRAGQSVKLWSQDANVRMEMAATAEQNGRIGDIVWVHLATVRSEDTTVPVSAWQRRRGVVRNAASVELLP